MTAVGLHSYLAVAGLLFVIGLAGVLLRRNLLVVFMCLEIMLNACNLALVAFSFHHATLERPLMDGHLLVLFVVAIAAAEVAVGLAIIVALFRKQPSVMAQDHTTLQK